MRHELLSRLSPLKAEDLDSLLQPYDQRYQGKQGKSLMGEVSQNVLSAGFLTEETVCIALHLKTPPEDPLALAMKLAVISSERNVEVIILSEAPYSRLEPYGFRTERIGGHEVCEQQAAIAQLRQFWQLQVILPA